MSTQLVVWSGPLWPSVWPAGHATWLAVSTGSVNPPTHPLHPCHPPTPLYAAAGCVQNISQNQPVQPVAI